MKSFQSHENILLNLATGDKYSVLDVVNGCEKYLRKKIKYKFTKRREGDSEVLFSKSSLAESKLGWKPQNSDLKNLLTSMYNIYKNRG